MLVIFYSTSNGKIITIYEIYLHPYVQQLHAKKHPRQISQVALHQKMTPYFFYKDKYVWIHTHCITYLCIWKEKKKICWKNAHKLHSVLILIKNCTIYECSKLRDNSFILKLIRNTQFLNNILLYLKHKFILWLD